MEIGATPIAEKVAEKLVARIGRHLGYLFNYRSNILDLTQQIEKLRNGRVKVQESVNEANRQGDDIFPDVEKWLSRAEEIIKETDKFLEDERDANRGCFNLKLRYQQSKKASGQAGDILNEILEADKFGKVAHEPPPSGIGSSSVSGSEVFESRERTLNQIIEALRDDDVRMVGVWGMGGVGKTMLVQQVAKQANEQKLFDTVVMALNISQTPNVTKIQGEIASMLGLKLEEGDETGRAVRLSQSLKKHKKILVILDDIWEPIAFERIGIPYGSDDHKVGYCKALLTSRKRQVLYKDMGTHKDFHVQHLCKEEAWSLFKQTAGDSVEKPEFQPIADEVVEKCEGLPVAIVTIAKALKGEEVGVWRNALKELKRSAPTNIRGVSESVYSCLELSYNHLESDEVKSLFLLCGLLGDGDISLDDLLKYGMGLDLFDYMDSLEQARDKIVTLVKILKDSSLLLDSLEDVHYRKPSSSFFVEDGNGFIRMHEVVRDVAKAIASKDPDHRFVVNEDVRLQEWENRDGELRNCAGISLKCTHVHELPEGLVCPKLRFFLLNSNDNSLKIPDTFFKEMKEVRVLSLFRIDLTQLPSSLYFLSNLRTLCLHECGMLKDIAILGGLKKLQILSLVGCEIQEFPKEMKQLTDLRMLNLRDSSILVPRNVISSLARLEHICMMSCNNMWRDAAWLSELKHLSCLRALEVEIPDSYLLPQDVSFENLTRYEIFIGCTAVWYDHDKRALRRLTLQGVKGPHLVKCFSRLLKTVEVLELRGLDDTKHFVYELDNDGFRQLKYLFICAGSEMQYIMNTIEMEGVDPPHSAFPLLEELRLYHLYNLEAVCHGPIPIGCFANLRILIIEDCYRLKYILWLPTTQGRESVLVFPQLRFLELRCLPNLIDFYSIGSSRSQEPFIPFFNQKVALPGLELLRLHSMENVITIWDNQHPVGSSSKLKDLYLFGCNNLLTVFPSNFLKGLQSLQILEIEDCCSLKEIFEVGEINREKSDGITIPQLKEMSSYGQNIMSVKKKDPQGYLAFQNLNSLKVGKCASLRYLFPASVVNGLMQLEVLEISDCGVEEIVANENGLEAAPIFLFPKLTSLKLIELYQLKRFYRGMYTLGCPLLKELVVRNCDEVELLLQEKSLQGEVDKQPLFLVEKVSFPTLESLNLSHKLKEIQHLGALSNLGILIIENCPFLSSVLSSDFVQSLRNLKKLTVKKCDLLEEVFDLNGLDHADNEHVEMLSKLEELSLIDLPMLRYICNNSPRQISCFKNLELVRVKQCDSLVYLFSASMALAVVKLKHLHIENCSMIEEIVIAENGATDKITFPQITQLSLLSLPNLASFYPGSHTLRSLIPVLFSEKVSFPNLEILKLSELSKLTEIWDRQLPLSSFCNLHILEVKKCPFLFNVVPNNLIASLQNLEKLNVEKCDQLKEVFDLEGLDHADYDNPTMLSKLEELKLIDLPQLGHICNKDLQQISFFQNLRVLQLKQCGSLTYLFSASMALGLVQLNNLWVEHCSQIKEIIKAEDGVADKIIFPQTTKLSLLSLSKLTSFYLRTQAPGMLFNEEVAFPSLGDLDISNLDSVEKIWHNEFVADSFGKLKRLSVRSCQKLRNVIPSNMLKRLPSLQILKIVDSNSLEEIFDLESIDSKESHDIPTLQLRELCLDDLEKLKCVWNKAPQGLLTYPNLKSVQVSHCPSLIIPYEGYVVRSLLQVKEVEMNSCGVKEIVSHEDIAKVVSMFFFPEVTSLTSSCLKQLECFYLGLHNLEWPMLKTLEVESHESLEKLASKLDKPVEQPIFLCDKVTFPNLEFLNLSLKLKEMQDLHVLFGALSKLKILIVEKCPFLLSLFSPQFIKCLNNLKELTVENCNLLEEVFDLKGLAHGDDEHVEMLSKLEKVSLIDLPQLRDICNNSPPQVLCFQNLKSLQVKQCNRVTYLFSPSMVLGLVQLQDLHIEHCPALKEIFTMEGRDTDNWPPQVSCFQNLKSLQVKHCESLMYLFPYSEALGLQDLYIERCSKMKKIIKKDGDVDNRPQQVSSLQNLKFVRVKQCDSLMYLFSASMALGLVQLQDLCIEDCLAMREIVTAEDRDFYNQPRLVSCFQNLKSVQVKQCDSLMYLFSSSFALALVQLQDLRIEHCCTMKEIVTAEEGVRDEIIFPQTKCISLLKLPKLATFYLSQNLEKIHMGSGVLFNEEVAFPKLEILYVSGLDNVKKIWHNQLLADSLVLDDLQPRLHTCNRVLGKYLCWQNLKVLKVRNCGSLKNIFSPCMALGLVPLEGMKEITKLEGAEAVIDKIEFPELTSLSLQSLPSLASFYPGSHTLRRVGPGDHDILITVLFNEKVAFPSLVSLHISGLDNIKEIWNNKRTANSFSRLEEVKVEDCNELQKGLPLFALKWLSSLQFLRIANCGKLKEVFDLKMADILDDANCGKLKEVFDLEGADILDDVTETQLNKLELHDLPQLQYIWNRDPYGILTFENLDLVEVLRCQVLKGQYPICLTRDLSQLEKQLIRSRWKKDLEGKDEGEDFVFPEVTYDKLLDLRKIKGKEVVVVSESDYVGEISEDMPGSSG